MNPTTVFTSRVPAVARTFRSVLAAVVGTLPVLHSATAGTPGTLDPDFTPGKVAATVYALLYETDNAVPTPNDLIFAGGDNGFLQTDLQTNGITKDNVPVPAYGASGRIVFAAATERFLAPGQTYPKVLLGGLFGQSAVQIAIKQPAQNIVRILADGTQDTTFNVGTGSNGFITSILPLVKDGKIVVGGQFTTFAVQPRLRIVRLNNDGSVDGTFNASSLIDNDVLTLAESIDPATGLVDDKTLVGGIFNHVGGLPVTKLARLNADGSLDTSFRPVIDTRVNAITVQPDGKIIIGGEFTQVNGQPVARIARLNYDGSLDTTFAATISGLPAKETTPVAVYVFAPLKNGKIYVGGNFSQVDGAPRQYLGLINPDGTVDPFDPGLTIYDKVQSLAIQTDGRVLVGETLGPKIGSVYQPSYIRLFGATTTNTARVPGRTRPSRIPHVMQRGPTKIEY